MGLEWSNGHPSKRMFIPFIFSFRAAHFQHVCAIPLVKDDPIPGALGQLGQLGQLGRLRCQSPESQVSHAGWQRTTAASAHLRGAVRGERGSIWLGKKAGWHGFHHISSINGPIQHNPSIFLNRDPWRVDPWLGEAQRHPMLRNPSSSSSMCGPWWTLVDLFRCVPWINVPEDEFCESI